jgi:putative ABC transport system permease protein
MLRNYLKIALRNLLLQKTISFINISGLAFGLASFIVIFLYVQSELSYDNYNASYKKIVRVVSDNYARTPAPLAEALRSEFPEIANTVRIAKADKVMIGIGNTQFYEENIVFADPSILKVFTFPVVDGDQNTALNDPLSIVLTQEAVRKYFGNTNPLGQSMKFDNKYSMKVTGVLKDIPANSHLHFDFLVSMASASKIYGNDFLTNPLNTSVYTYLLLQNPLQAVALRSRFPDFIKKYYRVFPALMPTSLVLQPLSTIHLYSDLAGEAEPNGDIRYVYIFSGVGIVILLMACINYTNILTARYSHRIKEIGVRKVLGADRVTLIKQFICESVFTAAIAAGVGVTLVELILPIINSFIDHQLALDFKHNMELDIVLAAVTFLTGVLSASYPALVLSSFQPSRVFRKSPTGHFSGLSVRSVLVVFQFLVSTGLIISTAIISDQLTYIRNKKLGFEKEHVIILPLREENTRRQRETFKDELLKENAIVSASASSVLPGDVEYCTSVVWSGSGFNKTMDFIYTDYDFIKTYMIELTEGRDLSKRFASDIRGGYILNEAAVREIGWKKPIGQKFGLGVLNEGTVIGVMKDFNYKSLHEKIKPLFIAMNPDGANYLSIRINPGNIPATLSHIRQEWTRLFPQSPFEYFFFDNHLDRLYKSEDRLGKMFNWFSGLAMVIACLGLFGLTFISTTAKKKEIGIRRVLGAPVASIVRSICKEFLFLVLLANIIAWPLAWYAMNTWLQAFFYRIDIDVWLFVIASSLILVASLVVVALQAVRAATANPVESLRYE